MRKLLLFFLFCGALGFLAFFYKVPLVEQIARFALARAGFDQVVCDIAALSPNEVVLHTLSASKKVQGKKYSFALHDAALFFTLDGLQTKQLQQISINKAVVTLPEKEASQTNKTLSLPSEHELEEKLKILDNLVLPVENIAVEELILNNSPLPGIHATPITLNLSSAADKLEGVATLPLEQRKTLLIKLVRTENSTYNATLKLRSEQLTQTFLDLETTRQHLSGSGAIDLHSLIQHFPQLGLPAGYTGTASYTFSAKRPGPPTIQLKSRFNNLKTDKVAIHDGTLDLTAQLTDLSHITIQEGSLLTLNGIQSRVTIDSARLGLGGTFSLNSEEIRVQPTPFEPWLLNGIDAGTSRVSELKFFLPIVTKKKNTLELTPAPAGPIRVKHLDLAGLHIPGVELSPTTAAPVRLEKMVDGALTVLSSPWQTSRITLQKAKQQYTAEQLLFTIKTLLLQPGGIVAQCNVDAGSLKLASPPYVLPLSKVHSRINLKNQGIQATLDSAFPTLAGHLKLNVEHNLSKKRGKGQLTTSQPIVFTQEHGLSSLIQGLDLPVQLSAGQLELTSEMEWLQKKRPQIEVKAHLTQAAGSGAHLTFSGAETSHHLQLLPELRSITPGTLTMERVQGPVLLQDLESSVIMAPSDHGVKPKLRVNQFSCNLLEGTLRMVPFSYDPNIPDHLITATAEHIDLSAVTKLIKVKGLEVDGSMSGTIPLLIEGKTLSVTGGALAGDAQGGTIRYKVEGLAEQQSQLTTYALKALEEFHFSVLQAPVTYHPDGTLLVDIHLQGTSPSLDTSRPVHLNVHTEQNLLSLLKSLRYDKVFTDKLNSRLQKRPQQP